MRKKLLANIFLSSIALSLLSDRPINAISRVGSGFLGAGLGLGAGYLLGRSTARARRKYENPPETAESKVVHYYYPIDTPRNALAENYNNEYDNYSNNPTKNRVISRSRIGDPPPYPTRYAHPERVSKRARTTRTSIEPDENHGSFDNLEDID